MGLNGQAGELEDPGDESLALPDVVVIGQGINRPWDLGSSRTGTWTRAQETAC